MLVKKYSCAIQKSLFVETNQNWLLLILQTSGETRADEWRDECRRVTRRVQTNERRVQTSEDDRETSTDEWETSKDEWETSERRVQANERRVKTSERRVQTNERRAQTNHIQMRTVVYLRDNSKCLRTFTLLIMLTNLMFKTSSLFPYFGYFGPYSR